MRTSYSGCASRNRSSRGTSHLAPKDGATLTVTMPPRLAARIASAPSASRSKPSRSAGRAASPASVSRSARVRRRKSSLPQCSSSARTCWLIAAGVTCSSSAARLKLRWRAAASKARRLFSGGRRRLTGSSMEELC